ncbi:MAG: type III pantothenate kinase [Planctomycetes bacterium]|nr:type III pantothenate kinase [Planctomycetota bacterium]
MLLCCDVGNTTLHLGRVEDAAVVATASRAFSKRGWEALPWPGRPERVAIASVSAPNLERALLWLEAMGCPRPVVLGVDRPFPIRAQVRVPAEAGADRLANAVAARTLVGAPSVVVDFGTATTFDVVDASGAYVGGAIAPGIGLAGWALAERTDRLMEVDLTWPEERIGHDTASCLRVGIVRGTAGLVEAILAGIRAEIGPCPVVATGGDAPRVAPHCPSIHEVRPTLTLEGIRIAMEERPSSGVAD